MTKEFIVKGIKYRNVGDRVQKAVVSRYKRTAQNDRLGRSGEPYERWVFVSAREVQSLHKGGFLLGALGSIAAPILARCVAKKLGLGF